MWEGKELNFHVTKKFPVQRNIKQLTLKTKPKKKNPETQIKPPIQEEKPKANINTKIEKEKEKEKGEYLIVLVTPSSRESEMNPQSQVSIIQRPTTRIRQSLIGLMDPYKPLRVLLNPIRGRHVRMVFPRQLLIRLLYLRQSTRLGYPQQLIETQLLPRFIDFRLDF